ncbi:MAG: geranylgeranyl reductase family protein [Thermoanaerobacteraceae bacterium]|nr:geranylgeranyl reductase family protein [Thermoanaerobacteraceae bacterium]
MSKEYFAVIVGAGPAGAFLAYRLASEGRPVALIDRQSFPRYKPCGGGISAKTAKLLQGSGIDFAPVVQDRVTRVVFTKQCAQPVTVDFDDTVIDMVMRDEFDDLLRRYAQETGAEFYPKCKFQEIVDLSDKVDIKTSQGNFKAKYLVGADGASSMVAKAMGQPVKKRLGFAVECELDSPDTGRFKGMVQLDHGHINEGYGWVFPKRNHLSIGIGSFSPAVRKYREHLDQFLNGLNIPHTPRITRGHIIPTPAQRKVKLHNDRMLLVSDAAGLADPMTGEGIYYALKSADLACHSLLQENLSAYSQAVNGQVLPELRQAKRVARIVYTLPGTIHNLIAKNSSLARMLVEVVYGAENYTNLIKSLLKANLPLGNIK